MTHEHIILNSMLARAVTSLGGVIRQKQDKYECLYKGNAAYVFALVDGDDLYLRATNDESLEKHTQPNKQISLMIDEKKYEFRLIKLSTIQDSDQLLRIFTKTFWAVSGKAYDSSDCLTPRNYKFIT